jgi:phage shock protein PspC (stress-responsive transcriptional regulator)
MFRAATPPKKLARAKRDKKIAGVCAGFGEYLELDVTLVRLLWLMLVFFGGWGLIAYLVSWIVMPEQPESEKAPEKVAVAAPQSASSA